MEWSGVEWSGVEWSEWNIVDHTKTHNLALVVRPDVNAHNTAWNRRICNKVGMEVIKATNY